MLSWTKRERAKPTIAEPALWSHMVKTNLGSAIIHEMEDGRILMDMWKPDQTNIGTGMFPSVDVAKSRAEAILDPRATCWDMLYAGILDEAG
jgi:hypothetical protein